MFFYTQGGIHLTSRIQSCLFLFCRIVSIQLLTCVFGVCLINMVFDPLGGGGNTFMLCLSMMLSWFLWGWITPEKARAGRNLVLLTLSLWIMLTGGTHLLWGDSFLLHVVPQFLTGLGFLELWPGSHHTRWYLDVLEPVMMTLSHFLLPAMFGLGMLLPPPRKDK